MSESISTNIPSSSFATEFFNMDYNEMYKCSIYNLKTILFLILLYIIYSLFKSFFSCEYDFSEHFSNNYFYSPVKGTINNTKITQLSSDTNMMTAQAELLLSLDKTLNVNVYGNLYILNGSPYESTIQSEKYIVNVVDSNGSKIFIDTMYRDNDGVYKIKFKTSDQTLIKNIFACNLIQIIMVTPKDEKIIVQGTF